MNMFESKPAKIFRVLYIIVPILLILGGAFGTWFFYQKYQKLVKNPQQVSQDETAKLKQEVGKIFTLPEGEEPNLATVLEKEKLKDQPFFTNAENGDKILIYYNAKKAILYRPSTGKIIEVGPVSYGNDQTTSPTSKTSSATTAAPKK